MQAYHTCTHLNGVSFTDSRTLCRESPGMERCYMLQCTGTRMFHHSSDARGQQQQDAAAAEQALASYVASRAAAGGQTTILETHSTRVKKPQFGQMSPNKSTIVTRLPTPPKRQVESKGSPTLRCSYVGISTSFTASSSLFLEASPQQPPLVCRLAVPPYHSFQGPY